MKPTSVIIAFTEDDVKFASSLPAWHTKFDWLAECACGSPKDRPQVVGAISGDSDQSAKGILDAYPIGFRTRNV